ncbi:SRPBCC family protein [Terrabacter terrigena]|uniref:SRPBCC family protein n=1 Tax=Terrabacter terrigena TaxID=574718 RepID=A0ABW3MYG3_9MICO
MGAVDFELERRVNAPPAEVFARLVDIEGYNVWMPPKGSIRRHSEQTSAGAPAIGTTYVDKTLFGPTPGEISELEAPKALTYHWWDRSRSGRLNMEGWPAYTLEAAGDGATVVRHHVSLRTHRIYRLATPVLRLIARRERTAVLVALAASFEPNV